MVERARSADAGVIYASASAVLMPMASPVAKRLVYSTMTWQENPCFRSNADQAADFNLTAMRCPPRPLYTSHSPKEAVSVLAVSSPIASVAGMQTRSLMATEMRSAPASVSNALPSVFTSRNFTIYLVYN
jgi:hypothetical protein